MLCRKVVFAQSGDPLGTIGGTNCHDLRLVASITHSRSPLLRTELVSKELHQQPASLLAQCKSFHARPVGWDAKVSRLGQ